VMDLAYFSSMSARDLKKIATCWSLAPFIQVTHLA
jgi:hypothetical protein